MMWKSVDLSIHNPIWSVLTQIIKNDRLKYVQDKPVIDITFKFNNKDYKARVTNYDEDCSSIDVYRGVACNGDVVVNKK